MLDHDDHSCWAGCWDEHGVRTEDDRIVRIRAGVLRERDLPIAISVAGESPVRLTEDSAGSLAELMRWAADERQMLIKRRDEATADDDHVVLTREQWENIVNALESLQASLPDPCR
ncbi:hypothetical protein [Haloechinothrix salitolerans]|uniref:DUF397 domain-containing protein n=1 Tax=Haloechinothrix salitolerans TaxID=926830 RepID=A0ABW2C1Q3_9PSEU